MKRLYLLILLLPLTDVIAQDVPAGQSFTLEQCISYALENSVAVKNAVIDEKIAGARVKETRGIGLPQVNATVGLQHNQKLRRFFVEKNPNSPFGADLPGDDGDVFAMQNIFQLKSAGDAGLNVSQIIFNGSYLVGLQAASAYRDLAVKTSNQSKEQTVEQVSKAYYAVLINRDRMQIFENNIARVDSLLRTTKALNENGFAEAIDVDRIQVSLNNLKSEQTKFKNIQELSLQLLKFQMNYPMDQPIDVAGDIASVQIDENALNEYSLNWDYTQRSDYQILQSNKKLQSLDLKNKYAEALPSLVAVANLGYSTQSPNVAGLFKTETDFNDNGMIGPDKWYPYTTFGVSLNIPIFSGLQRTYRIQQSKLTLMKIENGFTSLKSGIDLEVKSAAINYLNAVSTMQSEDANRKLADNVAKVTKIKYQEGVGSNIEVIEAETSLRNSQINYYNALYDAIVAKIDLDKAYGKLKTTNEENK